MTDRGSIIMHWYRSFKNYWIRRNMSEIEMLPVNDIQIV